MKRFTIRTLATLSLWAGFGLSAHAQLPALTLEKAFETRPRQAGVVIPTPSPDQIARHKIDPIKGKDQATIGYVVRDADGKPVRQFVSYDNKSFNIIAYYLNGREAYRETYPPGASEAYQFRWLGPNGTKWGLDKDRDGKVDEWVVISPEEASQELLHAVKAHDVKLLESLLPTDENLKTLGLPEAEIARIKKKTAGAAKQLNDAAAALKLSPEARWVHLELGVPQTTPADAFGGRDDLVVHKNGVIVIQDGKETKLLHTGELLMVNRAWKIVEGPRVGNESASSAGSDDQPVFIPEIAPFVDQLDRLDKNAANVAPDKMDEYYGQRVAILEQIVAKLKPEQQTGWAKLLINSLGNLAESSPGANPNPAMDRLKQLKETFAAAPKNPLGPHAAFRFIGAEHGILMAKAKTGDNIHAAQEKHRKALEEFIGAYPKSADVPEAAMQLARSYDFSKDGEAKAKVWCEYLAKNFPNDPRSARAAGIVKRIECEGKPLDLAGTNLATGQLFNARQLVGKVVVVYYWASWSQTLAEDAKKLNELAKTYGPKGLEIVCVALDDKADVAGQWIQKLGLPGISLHAPGGIDHSPLAASYGILVAPHILIAGKDGKIVSRGGQMFTLEEAVKKLTK